MDECLFKKMDENKLKICHMKRFIFIISIFTLSVFSITAYSQVNVSINVKDSVERSRIIIDRMDSIKAKMDSVKAEIFLVTKNTREKKLLGTDIGWYNFAFAFLAFIVACISAVYDFRGFRESKRTADNVTRVSLDVQMAQFDDLIRHLYRNLVCTIAFTRKMLANNEHTEYPSEEHLLKLKVLPEDVLHLEKYNDNNDIYKKMHELKLLLRNYDIEIDTTMMHLKDKVISIDVLRNDLDTLTYKPLYLTNKILYITKLMIKLKGGNRNIKPFRNAASIITKEHIGKLKENYKLLDIHNYLDLNFANKEESIERPYDGLRRSRITLLKGADGQDNLSYNDIYDKDNPSYHEYCSIMEDICRQDATFNTFKKDITLGEFEFTKHLLTMLSIDATIELKKIHMIGIIKPNENK